MRADSSLIFLSFEHRPPDMQAAQGMPDLGAPPWTHTPRADHFYQEPPRQEQIRTYSEADPTLLARLPEN
jgi:hypothetical protein